MNWSTPDTTLYTSLNGPPPLAKVLNVAVVPGQLVRLTSGLALMLVVTDRVALLVTLVQAPLAATLYVPSLAAVTPLKVKLLLVWLESRTAFFHQA